MDNDRVFEGRLRDQGALPLAAVVVLGLAGIIGLALATEGVEVSSVAPADPREVAMASPSVTPVSRGADSPIAPPTARTAVRPTLSPSRFAGLIGLPPADAVPSTPEVGELLESYWVDGGGMPYRGTARLYADGRLVWNRYYSGPAGHYAHTTGYLEQRLAPDATELVRSERYLRNKDPLELLERLPLDAWEARTPVLYVPSGYGICLFVRDPRPGQASDSTSIEPARLITMLPASVSSLLEGREFVSPIDWEQDCVAQTIEETRALERVLRDGGFTQDPFANRFMVQFSVDLPGAYGTEISLMFEPRFPDGSIGCSACG